jgi:hypothetical protein
MWLVLCESTDAPANWAYQGLKDRGLEPIERVTADVLAQARFVHRIGGQGVNVEIDLPDGRKLLSDRIRGTLNRLMYPPQASLLLIDPVDRDYVVQEMTAIYMSWINALPGQVMNPATPQCLSGHVRHISEWIWLAGKAGLPAPIYRQSSRSPSAHYSVNVRLPGTPRELATVFIVGQYRVGAVAPQHIIEGCHKLAEISRTPLLGIEFSVGAGNEWAFAGVTTFPDLRAGGHALLDALAASLKDGWRPEA